MSVVQKIKQSGWQASLGLEFENRNLRTALTKREHRGPLVVQKPFYPEGSPCHVYLLHPPGGVVGGDELTVNAKVSHDAHALITTPASGKFYRSQGQVASLRQNLHVHEEGILEWLPQDTILFSGSNVNMITRIDLEPEAKFIGWEIMCLGRPASDEQYDSGHCRQRLEVWQDNQPLLLERTNLDGGSTVLTAPWGHSEHPVLGTMMAAPAGKNELAAVRAITVNNEQALLSTTLINNVLVCRYLGSQGEAARNCFIKAWEAIRPLMLDREACPPRVWKT